MTDRELFLGVYYLSGCLSGYLISYLYLLPQLAQEGGLSPAAGRAEQGRFGRGMAGVAGCLLRGDDGDVLAGLEDFRREGGKPRPPDVTLFYCRCKAMAALFRPYFSHLTDQALFTDIRQTGGNYPHPPKSFNGWDSGAVLVEDALSRYYARPTDFSGGQADFWVSESFSDPQFTRLFIAQGPAPIPSAVPDAGGFLRRCPPFGGKPGRDIEALVAESFLL